MMLHERVLTPQVQLMAPQVEYQGGTGMIATFGATIAGTLQQGDDQYLVISDGKGGVFLSKLMQDQQQWHGLPAATVPALADQQNIQAPPPSSAAVLLPQRPQQWHTSQQHASAQTPLQLQSTAQPYTVSTEPATAPVQASQPQHGLHSLLAAIEVAEGAQGQQANGKRKVSAGPSQEPASKRVQTEESSSRRSSPCGSASNTPRHSQVNTQPDTVHPQSHSPCSTSVLRTTSGMVNNQVQLWSYPAQAPCTQRPFLPNTAAGPKIPSRVQQASDEAWVPAAPMLTACAQSGYAASRPSNSDDESVCEHYSPPTALARLNTLAPPATYPQTWTFAGPSLTNEIRTSNIPQNSSVQLLQMPQPQQLQQSSVMLVQPQQGTVAWPPQAPVQHLTNPLGTSLGHRQQLATAVHAPSYSVQAPLAAPAQRNLLTPKQAVPAHTSSHEALARSSVTDAPQPRAPPPMLMPVSVMASAAWPDYGRAMESALTEIMEVMLHKPRGRPVKYIDLGVNRMALKYHVGIKISGRVESMGATDTELAARMLLDMAKIGLGLYSESAAAAPPSSNTHPEEQMTSSLQHPPWQYSTAFVQRVVAQLINRNLVSTSELLHAYTRAHTAGCKPGPCLMSVAAALAVGPTTRR